MSRGTAEAAGFDHHLVKPFVASELPAVALSPWNAAQPPPGPADRPA